MHQLLCNSGRPVSSTRCDALTSASGSLKRFSYRVHIGPFVTSRPNDAQSSWNLFAALHRTLHDLENGAKSEKKKRKKRGRTQKCKCPAPMVRIRSVSFSCLYNDPFGGCISELLLIVILPLNGRSGRVNRHKYYLSEITNHQRPELASRASSIARGHLAKKTWSRCGDTRAVQCRPARASGTKALIGLAGLVVV